MFRFQNLWLLCFLCIPSLAFAHGFGRAVELISYTFLFSIPMTVLVRYLMMFTWIRSGRRELFFILFEIVMASLSILIPFVMIMLGNDFFLILFIWLGIGFVIPWISMAYFSPKQKPGIFTFLYAATGLLVPALSWGLIYKL